MYFYLRFFRPDTSTSSRSKMCWSTLNVHQLDTVISMFRIQNVLDTVYDNRLSRIEDLCKAQLIDECKSCSVGYSGTKQKLIERLFEVYGTDHMVQYCVLRVYVPKAKTLIG